MAARMWRLAGEHPGLTLSVMRCRFAGKERHLFPEACAIALYEGWVTRDDTNRLHRGPVEPGEVPIASAAVLAAQVDAALQRLQADSPHERSLNGPRPGSAG